MVRLVAFDLKEKSEYSQNLLKMFAVFVDIAPEVVVRVSLMHPIVHVAEPNSIPALSKQRSRDHFSRPRSLRRLEMPVSSSHLPEEGQTGNTWLRFSYISHNPVLGSCVLEETLKLFG